MSRSSNDHRSKIRRFGTEQEKRALRIRDRERKRAQRARIRREAGVLTVHAPVDGLPCACYECMWGGAPALDQPTGRIRTCHVWYDGTS